MKVDLFVLAQIGTLEMGLKPMIRGCRHRDLRLFTANPYVARLDMFLTFDKDVSLYTNTEIGTKLHG